MTTSRIAVGASTASLAGYTLDGTIAAIREMGFPAIELLAFAGARHSIGDLAGSWLDNPAETDALRNALTGFQRIATHAPFIDLAIFTHNPGIRAESLRQIRVAIAGTARLGGNLTTVHAHGKHFTTMEELWPDLVDIFRALGDYAGEHGVRIGLETMFPPTVEQYVGLMHAIAHPCVGATVDTGHVAWTVPQARRGTPDGVEEHNRNLLAICTGLGDRLLHFHVHDVRIRDWRDHRGPGTPECSIDWARLVACLQDRNFGGVLALELEEQDRVGALQRGQALLGGLLARGG